MNKKLLICFCFSIIGSFLYAMKCDSILDSNLNDFIIIQSNSVHSNRYENIDQQDDWGDTPLHRAIENENTNEIETLLEKGARCDITNVLEETPLALLFKKKQNGIDLLKYFHGCFFVVHNNDHKAQVPFLLQKNALFFNTVVENSMGMPDTQKIMLLLKALFLKAEKNEKYTQEGTVISIEKIDCFIQTKLSDLERLFGRCTVTDVKKVVDLYNPAKAFIKKCNNNLYEDAKGILFKYPLLQSDKRFNKYIMSELLTHHNEECWKFLLESGFNPKTTHPLFGTILHAAAQALNEHALYFLIYHGASVEAMDTSGKNPITILVESSQAIKHKESALSSLTVADKALKDRIDMFGFDVEHSAESLSLIIMRAYIDRMTIAKSSTKNKYQ